MEPTPGAWRRHWIENVNNSILLDGNALTELGTPAARRERRKCEHPIWNSVGPRNSGVELGYLCAAEVGVWLAALLLEGERSEATLGPADDENAPPDALNIWDAASAAIAWADKERTRGAARLTAVATPASAADLVAELDATRAAKAKAEERAAQFEADLVSAVAARESTRSLVAHLVGERAYLAGQLTRTYHRPWRPLKSALNYRLLITLSAASRPISRPISARFASSAEKYNPTRFDRFLAPPGAPVPRQTSLVGSVLVPEDERPLRNGDVAGVRLPTSDHPLVSVIIPCYGKAWLTCECLKSIARFPPATPFEVIVVDDASGELSIESLRNVAGLRLEINPTNLGFLKSCNRSAQLAKGDYLFFLNNDTIVCQGWLEPLLALFDRFPDAGLAGSKLLSPNGTLQEAGGIVWNDGSAWNYGRSDDPDKPEYNYVREADYISGCAVLISRSLWDKLGGFDEAFAPAYCEDSDIAFRVRAAGQKVYYCPFSAIIHLEGLSLGKDVTSGIKAYQIANTKKLYERWRDTLSSEQFPPGVEIMRARDRSRDRKTALVVDHYIPQPDQDAGSRTMLAIIECLREAGYVVKFWPDNLTYDPDYTESLQNFGVEVFYGIGLYFDDWIKQNGHAIALAVLSRPAVAARYIGPLRRHSKAMIAFYGHDLHFQRLGMQARRAGDAQLAAEAAAIERTERSVWRHADVVLYPSPEETAVARSVSARAATIIPYAYDDFGDGRRPANNHEILFVAGFAHPPNADAAVWLAGEVMKLICERVPDATLALVGANPSPTVRALAGDRVEVAGRVSEDELRARYARARIAMVPLRVGAGVKSKVVESLREGLPLVTTSVGAQGLPGLEHAASIADDPRGLADAAVTLLLDDAAWIEASVRQVQYARKHFSRDAFRRSFLEAIGDQRSVASP
jgi:O-antigen biosynthesis protein